jgi:hypothetical protein
MKKNLAIIIIVFLSHSLLISQNDTILKLFRTTYIENKQKITMLESIETLKNVTLKNGNNHYSLKKGTYLVADSISIELNNLEQIISISFFYDYAPDYSNDTAYIHELHKYQKTINSKGREYQYISKSKSIKVTKWEDNATIFELVEVIINNKKQVYSVIFDKNFYYKKVKSCIDLNKNENSIELLNRLGLI